MPERPRIKAFQKCEECGKLYHRHAGNTKARVCSLSCAGKRGGRVKIALRGTGKKGYVKEFGRHQHRIVAEKMLGRKLRKGEIVHHIDGDKHNNCPSNLKILSSQKLHCKEHNFGG